MTAYDPRSYDPDDFGSGLFPEGTMFSLGAAAKLFQDPSTFPTLDDPRSAANSELGREVIQEVGAIAPHTPSNDYWVRMDVRLACDEGGDFSIEVGPFDFDRFDIGVLKDAIAAWERFDCGP